MRVGQVIFALLVVTAMGLGVWWALLDEQASPTGQQSSGESAGALGTAHEPADVKPQESALPRPAVSSEITYRELISQRVVEARKPFKLPQSPHMRSPSGEKDPLQCEPADSDCDLSSPHFALSWDEAQWMRRHGFLDAKQVLAVSQLSDEEIDERAQLGDPAAVSELAKRYLARGDELEAKEVLMDGIRGGNIFAAHQLAAVDEGRSLPFNKRPGLEWLLVARRMGDSQVGMSYILTRYPNLQPQEIDHAMLVADRRIEQFRLNSRVIERRPDR